MLVGKKPLETVCSACMAACKFCQCSEYLLQLSHCRSGVATHGHVPGQVFYFLIFLIFLIFLNFILKIEKLSLLVGCDKCT